MFDKYAKAVVGAIVAGLTAVVVVLSDGILDSSELLVVITAVLGSFGLVWAVPYQYYLKAVAAAGSAGGTAFLAAYADGVITGNEWYGILAAAIGGLAVYQQASPRESQDSLTE